MQHDKFSVVNDMFILQVMHPHSIHSLHVASFHDVNHWGLVGPVLPQTETSCCIFGSFSVSSYSCLQVLQDSGHILAKLVSFFRILVVLACPLRHKGPKCQ